MPPRGRPRSFDRQQALLKAIDVFWAKGYDNTSIAELCEAIGIAPPSLYAAFGDKESLFREAAQLYDEREGTDIWAALDEASTARDAIERLLVRSAHAFTRRGRPRGCLITLGCLHTEASAAAEDLRARRRENLVQVRQRLDKAVQAGELPAGTDAVGLARFYLTVQEGMSIQARDGASRNDLLKVAATAMAAWPADTRRTLRTE